MRILFLSPRQCWPTVSGAKLREYHSLLALSQLADITYVYFVDVGDQPLSVQDLPIVSKIVAVPKPDAYSRLRLLRGIAGRWPLPILNYTSSEMTAALAQLDGHYDLVHLDSIHMMGYAKPLERMLARRKIQPRFTYNWHNIESEAMRRFAASTPSRMRRIYANLTAAKLEALEREILKCAYGHIVCSEREKSQLLAIAPSARVTVIENGVDCPYYTGLNSAPVRNRIVFVGKMDYPPNIEASTRFAKTTWPLVKEHFPEFTLSVVGSCPTASVEALRSLPGVEVTGTVPDVRPYYRDALAAVVPLRTGGGTRLKILEAMAAGVPVISTSLGAEGLAVSPGSDILIAGPDDHGAWVRHLLDLRQSEERRQQITARAHQLVESRYDWSSLRQSIIETYESWLKHT